MLGPSPSDPRDDGEEQQEELGGAGREAGGLVVVGAARKMGGGRGRETRSEWEGRRKEFGGSCEVRVVYYPVRSTAGRWVQVDRAVSVWAADARNGVRWNEDAFRRPFLPVPGARGRENGGRFRRCGFVRSFPWRLALGRDSESWNTGAVTAAAR